jgi:hypothetical protein
MGAASSTPSGLPSKEIILAKTKDGRDIVNQILDWMISKTSLRELYSLANPAMCQKYIFLTADALDILFKKIELEPKEGKKGVIYFQKVDELTKPPTSDDPRGRQRKVICLRLAFLYVRIFQVFASLSLSVLDVDPQSEIKFYDNLSKSRGYDDNVPLFGKQRGGALSSSVYLPDFMEVLRSSLEPVPSESTYYRFTGSKLFVDIRNVSTDDTVRCIYQYSGSKKITCRLGVIVSMDREIELTLSAIVDNRGKRIEDLSIRFKKQAIGDVYRDTRTRKTVGEALESIFQKIATSESQYDDKERQGKDQAQAQGQGASEGLHTKLLLEAFRQTMPVKAHCVSRAIQLLSDSGLKSAVPSEIYSSICKTKFLSDNHSLPQADNRLTQSISIYALAQLFYDTLKESTPAIGNETRDQYNAFLKKMKFVFEDSSTTQPQTLDDVKNRLPAGICDAQTKDKLLKVKNHETIRQLRSIASRMINYQINHTANVVKLLKKMFLLPIESGKPLAIHPNVRKNGMEEINKIAVEARNLLIEYYSQCEILYRSGAEVLVANKQFVKAV